MVLFGVRRLPSICVGVINFLDHFHLRQRGNGRLVNEFLSWKLFVPLGQLLCCVYISSYCVEMVYHMSQAGQPVHVNFYGLVWANRSDVPPQTQKLYEHIIRHMFTGLLVRQPFGYLWIFGFSPHDHFGITFSPTRETTAECSTVVQI